MVDAYHADRLTPAYAEAYDMAEPLVSVCIATMDRADLLVDRAVRSVLDQTYRTLQIVVVGDACRDDTGSRLEALGDGRIEFVNLPERGPYPRPGVDRWRVAGSNALNHALSLCQGQFITHLDDDDAMVPHRIETLLAAARQEPAVFLWHAIWIEDPQDTWTPVGNGRLEITQVTTSSIFYHRSFARIPWDVYAFRLGEPGDWNRLRKIKLLRPRLRYIEEPLLYHHLQRSQSAFVAREGERFLD
jgi:glycosyltransferase involved in cell wall biosynthesis